MQGIRKPTQKEINNHVPVEEPTNKKPDPKIKPPAGTPTPDIENPEDPKPVRAPTRNDHAKIQDPPKRGPR